MNVVALVESMSHVCCRYRVAAFEPYFRDAAITLKIVARPRTLLTWWQMRKKLQAADVVIVQRLLLSWWELILLRRSVKKLIFDYDDALWLRDSYSMKGRSHKRQHRFDAMARRADCIVAGNTYLAQRVPHSRTCIIPTCVEPDDYPLAMHQSQSVIRLVWVGSASTLQGLDRFRDVLEAIGKELPGLRLKLICDQFLKFDNLEVEAVAWSEATESREIANADIGISYVPDDDWSRGKCGLKILQYQAAGLPVVTNPVGVHIDMVRNDETGYLTTTTQEWIDAIARLSNDAELRQRLGSAGRTQMETRYSVAVAAQTWIELLREIVRD